MITRLNSALIADVLIVRVLIWTFNMVINFLLLHYFKNAISPLCSKKLSLRKNSGHDSIRCQFLSYYFSFHSKVNSELFGCSIHQYGDN